jgi:bacteriophage N4 adsorption protein B
VPLADWGTALLVLLAAWILVSGLDDLFIDLAYFAGLGRVRRPTEAELASVPRRRIAVLVPLWREQGVIGRMLEHNLAAVRYEDYDVFVGVYPNDPETLKEARRARRRHPRVHVAMVPHGGPTSKADCLNAVYRAMAGYEAATGERFDMVSVHDAEDVMHPQSLQLMNWFAGDYAMVQVPVLPLATPPERRTHGLYCDEFAEYQLKDIPVRRALGGFVASNGVGTAYRREALERLAEAQNGVLFHPECLTEDYEMGYRLHEMGFRQLFVPVWFEEGAPVATREYFPSRFRAAVRQRTRWVTGIALQGWERHGWGSGCRAAYWFWRDRKGLVGNLLSPVANAGLAWATAGWILGRAGWALPASPGAPPSVQLLASCTLALAAVQLGVRASCSARIYGARFALGVLPRAIWGNAINFAATVAALRQYAAARLRKRARMEWRKTEHVYPAAVPVGATLSASAEPVLGGAPPLSSGAD